MEIETHPFEPWLPSNARLLLLGTFPPAPKRWCMEWYYPNYTNDMWRIFGHVFFGDKQYFVNEADRTYKLDLLGDHKEFRFGQRVIRLYREPSSSRAYPMKVEKKAEYYRRMFEELDLLG